MRSLAVTAFLVGLVVSPSAFAATVDSIVGKVSLNRGEGYRQLAGPTAVARAGDQVMAFPGGSARVVYPDQCVVAVNPGMVITVREESPCRCKEVADPKERKEVADPKELKRRCPGFIAQLGPFAIGTGIAAGAFLISTLHEENRNRPVHEQPASP
jgi:hypothetical protein